jgi:hypothetical protein
MVFFVLLWSCLQPKSSGKMLAVLNLENMHLEHDARHTSGLEPSFCHSSFCHSSCPCSNGLVA